MRHPAILSLIVACLAQTGCKNPEKPSSSIDYHAKNDEQTANNDKNTNKQDDADDNDLLTDAQVEKLIQTAPKANFAGKTIQRSAASTTAAPISTRIAILLDEFNLLRSKTIIFGDLTIASRIKIASGSMATFEKTGLDQDKRKGLIFTIGIKTALERSARVKPEGASDISIFKAKVQAIQDAIIASK